MARKNKAFLERVDLERALAEHERRIARLERKVDERDRQIFEQSVTIEELLG